MNNLESLLKELGCKTPAGEIDPDHRDGIMNFLTMELEYRKQHKIKRLLRLSGIRQVKTLEQFDWHFNPASAGRHPDIRQLPLDRRRFNLVLIGDTGLGKSHMPQLYVMRRSSGVIPLSALPPSTSFQES